MFLFSCNKVFQGKHVDCFGDSIYMSYAEAEDKLKSNTRSELSENRLLKKQARKKKAISSLWRVLENRRENSEDDVRKALKRAGLEKYFVDEFALRKFTPDLDFYTKVKNKKIEERDAEIFYKEGEKNPKFKDQVHLSSGEKQIINLFYKLIFDIKIYRNLSICN